MTDAGDNSRLDEENPASNSRDLASAAANVEKRIDDKGTNKQKHIRVRASCIYGNVCFNTDEIKSVDKIIQHDQTVSRLDEETPASNARHLDSADADVEKRIDGKGRDKQSTFECSSQLYLCKCLFDHR